MLRLLTAASFALVLAGCSSGQRATDDSHSPAPASAQPLSGAQIQQAMVGRKLESRTAKGEPFWQTLSPGGAAIIKIADYSEAKGNWTISGDVICVTYKEYGEECNTVRSDGASIWLIDEQKKTTNNKFTLR